MLFGINNNENQSYTGEAKLSLSLSLTLSFSPSLSHLSGVLLRLTGEGEGAGAGDGSQGVGGYAFVQPSVFLGGLHDHQQLPAVGTGDHVHPRIDLQRLLICAKQEEKATANVSSCCWR